MNSSQSKLMQRTLTSLAVAAAFAIAVPASAATPAGEEVTVAPTKMSPATPAGKSMEEGTVAPTTMSASTPVAKTEEAPVAPTTMAASTPVAKSASATTTVKGSHSAKVEARISEMHAKLKITQAEEGQWGNVAGVMRDNAKTLDTLVAARMDNANTVSAIDDLKSYSAIADANAEGTKKFVTVFQTLYDSMSVAQKADADALFQGHRAGVGRTASKSHS